MPSCTILFGIHKKERNVKRVETLSINTNRNVKSPLPEKVCTKTKTTKMSENNVREVKISGFPKGAKLKQADIDFMKLIEAQNLERVKKLQKTRKSNILVGES